MNGKRLTALILSAMVLLALGACGSTETQPAQKPGVVYVDPNAAKTATAAPAPAASPTDAPVVPEQAPEQEPAPAPAESPAPEEGEALQAPLDLYFEYRGVRIEPMMEAAPVLAALGEPLQAFEADSCAYIGKDLFYYYPGFELTVTEVEGVNRITAITVADDTVTLPQGLRIYDDEEKLLSILGGTDEDGIYSYRSGNTLLLIQVKSNGDDGRRIASMEYHVADDQ